MATKAPQSVLDLVARFAEHVDAYHAGRYNETQLRREFIDPLFKALGWDVDNSKGYAEAYKDVIHEDAITVGGATKAPDYCFRIGGVRKFFVEAKKPSVDIRGDPGPAFQLRRYAWSAKLPLSILTDFEELAVYDCRVRPAKTDKPSKGRTLLIGCEELPERWDELASIFAREAILKGSFDKYAESARRKRGTAEVDEAFLAEIESWREDLARNIALRNPDLSQRDLNFAVQRTIDRIVFLRISEDRGIEPYGTLQGLVNGENVYRRLFERFERADERYNSGLFHFTREKGRPEGPDELTPSLTIDDKVLKRILSRLYYPESPYEFSVLPADILGQVYERFLGKVIRLTAGHHAKVEEKPEVRKAGGVYYTPTYIVDYIVRHTVGELVEGKSPQEVGALTKTFRPSKAKGARPLAVLDPACGSGSFLLGAYQFLLAWYRDRYVDDGPETHAGGKSPRLYQHASGEWRLTTAERKRILLSHVHGVDIDAQAVEVTKLSLLLKVLEGESEETLGANLRLLHERALPDLAANVKCGNSLIGPDFYEGRQLAMFDREERLRINAFDWAAEFPEIMASGGFDAVIGNPPYIRMEAFKELKDYLRANYSVHDERSDLYVYFIEREHELLRDGGMFGIIVSNKFLRANYGTPVRTFLSRAAGIRSIVDLAGLPVFPGATVRTIVLVTSKGAGGGTARYTPTPGRDRFARLISGVASLDDLSRESSHELGSRAFVGELWDLTQPEKSELLARLRAAGQPLLDVVAGQICMGIKSGLTDAFVIGADAREALVDADPRAADIIRPFLQGRHVRRYHLEPAGEYLIYTYHGIDMDPYPAVLEHLRPFRKRLEGRATDQAWYELQQPQFAYNELLERPKIVFPDMATSCRFALDSDGHFGANTVYFLPTDDLWLLGLLNSGVAHFYFAQTCAALEGPGDAYLRFLGQYLKDFPVAPAQRKAQQKRMLCLVETMLDLQKDLAAARTGQARTAIQRQIDATDRRIDRLVYDLYGLTDAEIAIVEEAT